MQPSYQYITMQCPWYIHTYIRTWRVVEIYRFNTAKQAGLQSPFLECQGNTINPRQIHINIFRDCENWAEPINLKLMSLSVMTLQSLCNLAGLRFSRVICGHCGALCAITAGQISLSLKRGAQHQRPDDGQRQAPQHLQTRSHKQQ